MRLLDITSIAVVVLTQFAYLYCGMGGFRTPPIPATRGALSYVVLCIIQASVAFWIHLKKPRSKSAWFSNGHSLGLLIGGILIFTLGRWISEKYSLVWPFRWDFYSDELFAITAGIVVAIGVRLMRGLRAAFFVSVGYSLGLATSMVVIWARSYTVTTTYVALILFFVSLVTLISPLGEKENRKKEVMFFIQCFQAIKTAFKSHHVLLLIAKILISFNVLGVILIYVFFVLGENWLANQILIALFPIYILAISTYFLGRQQVNAPITSWRDPNFLIGTIPAFLAIVYLVLSNIPTRDIPSIEEVSPIRIVHEEYRDPYNTQDYEEVSLWWDAGKFSYDLPKGGLRFNLNGRSAERIFLKRISIDVESCEPLVRYAFPYAYKQSGGSEHGPGVYFPIKLDPRFRHYEVWDQSKKLDIHYYSLNDKPDSMVFNIRTTKPGYRYDLHVLFEFNEISPLKSNRYRSKTYSVAFPRAVTYTSIASKYKGGFLILSNDVAEIIGAVNEPSRIQANDRELVQKYSAILTKLPTDPDRSFNDLFQLSKQLDLRFLELEHPESFVILSKTDALVKRKEPDDAFLRAGLRLREGSLSTGLEKIDYLRDGGLVTKYINEFFRTWYKSAGIVFLDPENEGLAFPGTVVMLPRVNNTNYNSDTIHVFFRPEDGQGAAQYITLTLGAGNNYVFADKLDELSLGRRTTQLCKDRSVYVKELNSKVLYELRVLHYSFKESQLALSIRNVYPNNN